MKAKNLRQTLRFFDPRRPLSNEAELRHWFVPRPRSPRKRLRILLEGHSEPHDPQKILLVGHRGSGKTTELNKLSAELETSFHTIGFNVLEITGRTTPEYEDLMLTISTQVTRFCIDQQLIHRPLAEPVRQGWQLLLEWWQQLVAGHDIKPPATEQNLGVKLSTLLGQVEMGVKQSSTTRESLRFQLNQKMPELIRNLNWVIEQSEMDRTHQLLIVVEGLDKVDLKSAKNIFRDHAPTITAPKANMIYTFPLALRHSDDFNVIRMHFPVVEFLPNLCTHDVQGDPDEKGLETLRRLTLARIEEQLLAPDAMKLLLEMNGGIPVWLVVLVRNAALYAMENERDRIELADMENAVRDLRRDTLAPLSRADYEVLRARHEDKIFRNDEAEQRLLYNGSLIEYPNDVPWCDAHPVLWKLLEASDEDDG